MSKTLWIALAACAVTLLLATLHRPAPAAHGQDQVVAYLPDVESSGPPVTETPTAAATHTPGGGPPVTPTRRRPDGAADAGVVDRPRRLEGMEGWGDSIIDVQSRALQDGQVRASLLPQQDQGIDVTRALPGLGAVRLVLEDLPNVRQAFYRGQLTSAVPFAARVQTRWRAGGVVGYEAPEASDELILPLFARAVYSHTTIFYAYNVDEGPDDNVVQYDIYDPRTGESVRSWSNSLQPGKTVSYDTFYDDVLFGKLGENYLSSLHVMSDQPVAILAYGEEMGGGATSAYIARPVSMATTRQILPLVRSGSAGDTLIAVASTSFNTTTVHGTFVPAPWSGGSGSVGLDFTLEALGTGLIDLGTLGRGNVPRPSLGANFEGTLLLEASRPILAVAQEGRRQGNRILTAGAYNAFGDKDLATTAAAPSLRHEATGGSTLLVANPGPGAASVSVRFGTGADAKTTEQTVAAGAVARFKPADAGVTASAEPVSAYVASDIPVATLILDEGFQGSTDIAYSWGVGVAEGEPVTSTPTSTSQAPPTQTPTGQASTATPGATPTLPAGRAYLPWNQRR